MEIYSFCYDYQHTSRWQKPINRKQGKYAISGKNIALSQTVNLECLQEEKVNYLNGLFRRMRKSQGLDQQRQLHCRSRQKVTGAWNLLNK